MFQAPRGTTDLLPAEQKYWRYIESKAIDLAQRYGFGRIDTPVFEASDLFVRSVGEGTDIVEKEMYTFEDRGGDSVTLRPEGTAPVCRAYLEHGMHNLPQPVRLYYFCPVFRYERPQAGRFRQHHQFGAEVLGDADPSVDAEVIDLAWRLMLSLGLPDLSLLVNSIGDFQCRPAYIGELQSYYSSHRDTLCADCRIRLGRNPLRLLDCKVETCQALGDGAPRSADHLCPPCQQHWDKLQEYLARGEIPYRGGPSLGEGPGLLHPHRVRSSAPGRRFPVHHLRRRPLRRSYPGIRRPRHAGHRLRHRDGAAGLNLTRSGVEVPQEPAPTYLVANVGDTARAAAVDLAARLRRAGVGAILSSGSRPVRGQLRQANALEIPYALILGDDEIQRGEVVIRDMRSSTQETRPLDEFLRDVAAS